MKVILTNGSEPIGNGLGPVLEARDVLYVLKNHDYTKLAKKLAKIFQL